MAKLKTGTTIGGSIVWHQSNDGAGSGLDADLLDGQQGSYYLDWNNTSNKPDPTLTLSGDVSGSATFTDLGNTTLSVTIQDDSHNHIISNIDGLQDALNSKLSNTGKAADSNLLDGIDSSSFLRSDANDDFSGTLNYTPDTGVILSVDGQPILERMTFNGALTLGHDDSIIIAGGDTSDTLNSSINNATETVFIGAEGGLEVYAFPNNNTDWNNRKTLSWNGSNLTLNGSNVYHAGNINPVTGITHDTVNTELDVTFADGTTTSLDLSQYIDDTNLSKIVSGTMNGSGIATFTRDDSSTFTVDMSVLLDDTNLSRITNASWNTTNGVLTLTRNDSSTVAVDLDGRYLQSYSETDTLDSVTSRGNTTTNSIQTGGLVIGKTTNVNATTKLEMINNSALRIKPNSQNSTNMSFAQVDDGNSIGMQVSNGSGTANWDIALNPFGGRVGIGIANPSQALHVLGNVLIDDNGNAANATLQVGISDDYAENIAQVHIAGKTNTGSQLGGTKLLITDYDNDYGTPVKIFEAIDENGTSDVKITGRTGENNPNGLAHFRDNLEVGKSFTVNDHYTLEVSSAAISSTTQTAIATFPIASFSTGKIVIQAKDTVTGEIHASELLIVHDGTTAISTEYAMIYSGSAPLATYEVDISGGNVRVLATSASANNTTYKTTKNLIKV